MTATPWGFRDILPEEAQAREDIALTVRGILKGHGYLPVETPLLEHRDALGGGGRIADTPFKLFDDDGRFLVVRPDNTLPIVRMVASRLDAARLPLRLRYDAPVVRTAPRNTGASRQVTQLGFELIGAGGIEGDAEVVRCAAEVAQALDLPDWRVVCGSVQPYQELLAHCADTGLARRALELVHLNNLVDLDELVEGSSEPPALRRAVRELPRLCGGDEVLVRARELLEGAGADARSVGELGALAERLASEAPAAAERLSFDFSIVNSFGYYTGLVCKVYAAGIPESIGSGGRYDEVFDGAVQGLPRVPAAGFAFSLERLEAAVAERVPGAAAVPAVDGDAGREGGCPAAPSAAAAPAAAVVPSPAAPPVRIAVPKGSLNGDTLRVLEAAGLDVGPLRDPGRHLMFTVRDRLEGPDSIGDVEYIIVRAQDAPAFVSCGGADCGICGRDSLIEADCNLLQLVDLRFGACRFIEAEPAAAYAAGATERAYARRGTLRVATKYPRIAGAWYAGRGVNADILTLHGNIELGPIVGMADRIVDITATGTTLRENDLVVTGEIMTCTARFFASPGRARLDPRVRVLAARLADVVRRG